MAHSKVCIQQCTVHPKVLEAFLPIFVELVMCFLFIASARAHSVVAVFHHRDHTFDKVTFGTMTLCNALGAFFKGLLLSPPG